MKFRVQMKDPDGPSDCLQEEAERLVNEISGVKDGLDADEIEQLVESKREKLQAFARKWMRYGEYLTVEFDTEAGTATVVRE